CNFNDRFNQVEIYLFHISRSNSKTRTPIMTATLNAEPRQRKRLLIVFGTRPEALKCFPVARAALSHAGYETQICLTAQHREMADQIIALTGLPVHYDL